MFTKDLILELTIGATHWATMNLIEELRPCIDDDSRSSALFTQLKVLIDMRFHVTESYQPHTSN